MFQKLSINESYCPKLVFQICVSFLFVGTNQVKIYVTSNWWSQIKTAGAAIYANRHYLKLFRQTNPSRLAQAFENCNGNSASGDNLNHAKESNPEIIGDVYIHPSANIHPSAVVSNIKHTVILEYFNIKE